MSKIYDPSADLFGEWIPLAERRPEQGQWVLVYLTKFGGANRYATAVHMAVDDWMSVAAVRERRGLFDDAAISHWTPLPLPPQVSEEVCNCASGCCLSPGQPGCREKS